MSLTEARANLLRKQITSCAACHLHLYCTSPVPPSIPSPTITPELLIIGEAPGSEEDRKGEPFIGPAGRLFFRLLSEQTGISRKQVMIANANQCRPTVANKQKTNRSPSKSELAACFANRSRILRYYTQAGGTWMLLLGSTALTAFLPFAKITMWAGRPFYLSGDRPLYCLPTFHPAFALRDPNQISTIRRHLNTLAGLRAGAWPDVCAVCKEPVEIYDGLGVPWCEAHRVARREPVRVPEVPARQGVLV